MLTQRNRPEPVSPDDLLSGTCASCQSHVTVCRNQATPPAESRPFNRQPGAWNDLWSVGCGRCGAKVFLTTQRG